MGAADLFAAVSGSTLPAAALRLAESGVPVFPCAPRGKHPLTRHGFHDATADRRVVAQWWRCRPDANIGVPTGQASGMEVVDVDRRDSGSGFAAFRRARRAGLVPAWEALVRTPTGGLHAYFPAGPGRVQPSWQAARAHVDFRGAGGYVVAPPSLCGVAGGPCAAYTLVGPARPRPEPVDAAALRDFLDPRPQPAPQGPGGPCAADSRRLGGWVAALGEGERNRGLFWAACRLAESGAAPAAALDVLGPAAGRAGLPPGEASATIRSAYRAAAATPARPAGIGALQHGTLRPESRALS